MASNIVLLTSVFISFAASAAGMSVSNEDYILNKIMESFDRQQAEKRGSDELKVNFEEFNNCPQAEPFPCKTTDKCISLKHVCDGNFDCPDMWDEDQAVCIAYQRVPAEDLLKFVKQQANWLVPSFFSSVVHKPQDLDRIASALSTSPNIQIFQTKLRLSDQDTKKFEAALLAVRGNDVQSLESYGMNPDSWTEVQIVFKNLIDSGMIKRY
ncbi:IDLSRF-like peptide [Watersipora subatra]|uniref:IDLSRF-like peptide n=1 Tax=Watersipora subatra TaxID=2589382 RepID=UPI00355C1D13